MAKYSELTVICNGCGKPMRSLGEWPFQWPPDVERSNIQQTSRYACGTCRLPHADFPKGIPIMATIIEDEIGSKV